MRLIGRHYGGKQVSRPARIVRNRDFNDRAAACFGGWGWKSVLSRSLGKNYTTVKRWTDGGWPVPDYAWAALEACEALRDAGLPLPERFRRHSSSSAGPADGSGNG